MDVNEHLARQVAALEAAEWHVRGLALRETSRSLEKPQDPDERTRLGELQAGTNADFRRMREIQGLLGVRIDALLRQYEALYGVTFTRHGTGRS